MARKVTIAAFEKWIAEDGNEELVLEKIASGTTLRNAAFELKQPYTCLHPYFHSTPERQVRYDTARKAWADAKMDEAMDIADDVAPDRDAVAKAKLQVETYTSQAKAYNRPRWGETLKVEKEVTVSVDVGPATRLLQEARARELEVIDLPLIEEKLGG